MNMKEVIKSSLELFHIYDDIIDIDPFMDYVNFDIKIPEVKYIAKVTFKEHPPLVVRLTKEKHIDDRLIEKQAIFSEQLRSFGIHTPKKYDNDTYVKTLIYKNHPLNVTVETYIGPHLKTLSKHRLYQIGELLGNMHRISRDHQLKLNTRGYVFNLLGQNDVVKIDKLLSLSSEYHFEKDTINLIKELYDQYIAKIRLLLSNMQKFAVQGDINASNLSVINDELYVFDYNIACDEYLVVQAIIEGLLLSYEEVYDDNLSLSKRFDVFMKGYQSHYQFNDVERDVFPYIRTIAETLWFTKIHIKDDAIENLLKKNRRKEAKTIVNNMFAELTLNINN